MISERFHYQVGMWRQLDTKTPDSSKNADVVEIINVNSWSNQLHQTPVMAQLLKRIEVPHPLNEKPPTFLLNHDIKPIEKERRVWGKS
jgi:hypothetical protein